MRICQNLKALYMYVYTSYICIYKVLTIETESELVDENEAFFVLVATSDSLSNISTQDFLFFFLANTHAVVAGCHL